MAAKFTFDTEFDGGAFKAGGRSGGTARKSYSAREIEALKAEAYAQGRSDAQASATEDLAAAVREAAGAVVNAAREMERRIETTQHEAAELALHCAKRLAGAALSQAPESEIAETLRTALHQAFTESHITVKTAPALTHALSDKSTEIAAQEGYEGRIRIAADSSLHGADCRIEWRGGGIERNMEEIETALAEFIARRFPPQNGE